MTNTMCSSSSTKEITFEQKARNSPWASLGNDPQIKQKQNTFLSKDETQWQSICLVYLYTRSIPSINTITNKRQVLACFSPTPVKWVNDGAHVYTKRTQEVSVHFSTLGNQTDKTQLFQLLILIFLAVFSKYGSFTIFLVSPTPAICTTVYYFLFFFQSYLFLTEIHSEKCQSTFISSMGN